VLAHSPSLNQTRWDLNSDYSDRLLVRRSPPADHKDASHCAQIAGVDPSFVSHWFTFFTRVQFY
jgi:hypothetical protein